MGRRSAEIGAAVRGRSSAAAAPENGADNTAQTQPGETALRTGREGRETESRGERAERQRAGER